MLNILILLILSNLFKLHFPATFTYYPYGYTASIVCLLMIGFVQLVTKVEYFEYILREYLTAVHVG